MVNQWQNSTETLHQRLGLIDSQSRAEPEM